MTWFRTLILAAVAFAFPVQAQDEFFPQTTQVEIDPANRDVEVGELIFRGGVEVAPDKAGIGGISGLEWHDGQLYAVTDDGRWMALRPDDVAGRMVDVSSVTIGDLSDERGRKLGSKESGDAEAITRLLKHMLPPWPLTQPSEEVAGLFELSVPGLSDEPDVIYHVQTPPEYDPHRLYPSVITLHGSATTPQQQLDWWAGSPNQRGERLGQATRQGYIVIAPQWARPQQTSYDHGAAAHAAVLNVLRDACRRFSIDTDRVYLSGHAMGASAAWDIGLAHPDLWAGVIPVAGVSEKYGAFYWPNQEYVPLYFVGGQMDGDQVTKNARDLDRCLRAGLPVTVAQ